MTVSSRPDGWGFGSLRATFYGPEDPDYDGHDLEPEDGEAESTQDITGYLRIDMETHEIVVTVTVAGASSTDIHRYSLRFPIPVPAGLESVWDITARHY